MYKSYSYNNMPQPLPQKKSADIKRDHSVEQIRNQQRGLRGILDKMELDDVILLAIIIILLMNECDDMLLLLAIGYIFISEFRDEHMGNKK